MCWWLESVSVDESNTIFESPLDLNRKLKSLFEIYGKQLSIYQNWMNSLNQMVLKILEKKRVTADWANFEARVLENVKRLTEK